MGSVGLFFHVRTCDRESIRTMDKILDEIDWVPRRPWVVCQGCRDYVAPSHRCLATILDPLGNTSMDRSMMLDDLIDAVERVRDSIRELNEALEAIR